MPCEACGGKRLKPEALAVKVEGVDISDAAEMSIGRAEAWFGALDVALSTKDRGESPPRILKEINERLGFLTSVGLDYLTLSRGVGIPLGRREPAHPLGQPDRQRADRRAPTCFDEPSIGLHQRDKRPAGWRRSSGLRKPRQHGGGGRA